MDEREVRSWFQAYLADFIALYRGDSDDVRRVLDYYGGPTIISTDAGSVLLTDEDQVLAAARQQIAAMRAAGYDRSQQLSAATTVVNRTCALHRAAFARLRADGTEITRVDATFVITDSPAGRRISAFLRHSAS